ncbi:MAG: polysaccharide pyruvyl transferase family protein [Lachnospiraceae bacterium]|nr:polysaccharide pyruvyl transferase family protein [Lachnospiraceae bacterium]
MDKIICFDTSIATSNMGDYIIAESCNNQLKEILLHNFIIRFPTHTPIAHWYQDFHKTSGGRYDGEAKYKFIFGTNLMNNNMCIPTPLWNVNLFNAKMAKDAICVGVGLGSVNKRPNLYTKILLKELLSSNYIHSTRDEKTAEFLRRIGLRAINTGCATIWSLTDDHCAKIPTKKAKSVVFTLTDYMRDEKLDVCLINTLQNNYENVYFWIQGIEDYSYLNSIVNTKNIKLIPPSLNEYSRVLSFDIDYVGTRLHAGIKAMQLGKRSIIIEVDNRTSDMKECINLPTIKRNDIPECLDKMIQSRFVTKLNIDVKSINEWRQQFNEIE